MVRTALEKHRPAEPLLTRHVFLDTQVYRGLGHNPANPALILLRGQIEAHRVVLHTTDITLLEVKRQVRELVLGRRRELDAIEKDLDRWRKQAPRSAPTLPLEFNAEALSRELFLRFSQFVRWECRAKWHAALIADPEPIFAKYFDRKPPFDEPGSKEFPDAFVVEALIDWAKTNSDRIYVVTQDKAMTRAVEADPHLLALKTIHDVLARAAADLGSENEAIAESVINQPAFLSTLEQLLKASVKEAFNPTGELLAIEEVGTWSLVNLNADRISVILDVTAKVRMLLPRPDQAEEEPDDWAVLEDDYDLQVLVAINRISNEVVDVKVLARVSLS